MGEIARYATHAAMTPHSLDAIIASAIAVSFVIAAAREAPEWVAALWDFDDMPPDAQEHLRDFIRDHPVTATTDMEAHEHEDRPAAL